MGEHEYTMLSQEFQIYIGWHMIFRKCQVGIAYLICVLRGLREKWRRSINIALLYRVSLC